MARPKLTHMDHQRWAREEAARRPAPVLRTCASCGRDAPYGFGSFKDADGLWACREHRDVVRQMVGQS